MNVIVTVSRRKEGTYMKTFTIDSDNNITVHPSRKAARETGAGVFATEEQFADLIGSDNKRLVEIWNRLAGVKPVTKFANRKSATERIWKALQSLGEQAAAPVPETPFDAIEAEAASVKLPVAEPEHADAGAARPLEDATLQGEIEPVALAAPDASEAVEPVANVGGAEPQGAPAAATAEESVGPRAGSKTAKVVAMLQRKSGATLAEIMDQMGWQKHTVRGFMAGAMKKAGYTVESFKPEGGERTYRINQ